MLIVLRSSLRRPHCAPFGAPALRRAAAVLFLLLAWPADAQQRLSDYPARCVRTAHRACGVARRAWRAPSPLSALTHFAPPATP